jgi:hypothetical protein
VVPDKVSTSIRAKVWQEGTSEPTSWQVRCEDTLSDRLDSGTVGVWSMGAGGKYWDDFEVIAPSGDIPARPPGNNKPDSPPVDPPASPPAGPPSPPVDPGNDDVAFNEDFETSATGRHVPGWIDTRLPNSMREDDSLFSVTTLSGNRVLTTSSRKTDIHSHYAGSGSADWFRYEVKGRMRVSSSRARIGVTAYSQYPSKDVYYRLGSAGKTGEVELYRQSPSSNGTFICGSPGTGVIPQANAWYKFRFQVIPEDAGTRLRAKFWKKGDEQPTQWQAECTDVASNRPSSGTIGVWSGSAGEKYWDRLQVIALPEDVAIEPLGRPGTPKLIPTGP